MEPAAAYELYRRKVESQPPLGPQDDGLFEKMRAEDKQANLRLILGFSRWVVERVDAVPSLARQAHHLDPLALLMEGNAVLSRVLREYKGASIEEFRGIAGAALDARFRELFGHRV